MSSLTTPQFPLRVEKPDDFVSDHDKFDKGGIWFLNQARWRVLQYYNSYSIPNSYNSGAANATSTGIVTSTGANVGFVGTRSIVDDMLENLDYWNGTQKNRIFNFLTTGTKGNALPNVWIQGQEVFQLGQHIVGKGLEIIQPIEDNISCESISENALLKRQDIFEKIDVAAQVGAHLNELSGGAVKYAPAGDIDYSDPAQVKKAKDKVREEYENAATVIGRNVYYTNNLSQMFLSSVQDSVIGALTGIEFSEKNGKCVAKYIPCYQGIFDFGTWGEFGEGATTAGYIMPATLDEILTEYPDLSPNDRGEIEDVLYKNVAGASQFMDYYNQPFQNVKWWYNQQKWISVATIYWIGECNLPYVKNTNQFGIANTTKLYPYTDYWDKKSPRDEKGNYTVKKKGYEFKGDTKVYKVHKAKIAGNKYLLEYGYDTYQVRPYGEKDKPELPIQFFCAQKIAGYVKPIVSRLKPKQDELDAVRYRIREYAANDLGVNIFINGAKLTENLSALNIVNDLRQAHITVIPATGDEDADKRGIDDIVKVFSNNAVAAIKDYLVLKADILKEMKDSLNISDISLGDQQSTVGKGVQEQTIARAEISSLPFFSSLQEFWRRCIQYGANKSKMIMLDQEDKDVILPISNREVKLLKLTKEMKTEDLMVYLQPDDRMEVSELALFKSMLQALSQNPTIEHSEALVNTLKMMKTKSFGEGIALFEGYVDEKKKEMEKMALRQATQEQQGVAYQNLSNQQTQMQQQLASLMTELAKINLQGSWALKEVEAKAGADTEAKLSDAYISQITGLIQQQITAMSQSPAQQQAPQPNQPTQPVQQPQQEAQQPQMA